MGQCEDNVKNSVMGNPMVNMKDLCWREGQCVFYDLFMTSGVLEAVP